MGGQDSRLCLSISSITKKKLYTLQFFTFINNSCRVDEIGGGDRQLIGNNSAVVLGANSIEYKPDN